MSAAPDGKENSGKEPQPGVQGLFRHLTKLRNQNKSLEFDLVIHVDGTKLD
jgi:hypothetical protein